MHWKLLIMYAKRSEDYRLGDADLDAKFFAIDANIGNKKFKQTFKKNIDKICYKPVCSAGLNSLLVSFWRRSSLRRIFKIIKQCSRRKFTKYFEESQRCSAEKISKIL